MKAVVVIIFFIFYSTFCYALEDNKCEAFNKFITAIDSLAQGNRKLDNENCENIFSLIAKEYPPYLILERKNLPHKNNIKNKIANDYAECLNSGKLKYTDVSSTRFSETASDIVDYCVRYYEEDQLNNMFKGEISPCERFMLIANKLYASELTSDEINFINSAFSNNQSTFNECESDIKNVKGIVGIINKLVEMKKEYDTVILNIPKNDNSPAAVEGVKKRHHFNSQIIQLESAFIRGDELGQFDFYFVKLPWRPFLGARAKVSGKIYFFRETPARMVENLKNFQLNLL